MKLSIIVHLQSQNALHWRHLLNTLPSDPETAEVFIYHPATADLPELPSHWSLEAVHHQDATLSWKKGLEKAQGEVVSLVEHVVSFHAEHFEEGILALQNQDIDAAFTQPSFVNSRLLPVSLQAPPLAPDDFAGFLLQSPLHLPIENFIFRKSALVSFPFENTSGPRLAQLLTWQTEHQLEALAVVGLEAAFDEHWGLATDALLKQLMGNFSLTELLPSYATAEKTPDLSLETQAKRFVIQALHNQQALDWVKKKTHEFQLSPVTLCVSTPEAEIPEWFVEVHPHHPLLQVCLEDAPSPLSTPLVFFDQRKGIPQLSLYGFSSAARYSDSYENTDIEQAITRLVLNYRPLRVHFFNLKPFGARLLSSLINSNYPTFYSVSRDDLTATRQALRYPTTLADEHPESPEAYLHLFQERNQQCEHLVTRELAALLVHSSTRQKELKDQGYTHAEWVDNATTLRQVYERPVTIATPDYPQAFASLYSDQMGKTLSQHIADDADLFTDSERVLCVGDMAVSMTLQLLEQSISAQAVLFDKEAVQKAQSQGIPVHLGKHHALAPDIHAFDSIYLAYTFEQLESESLRQLVGGLVMALKKGGKLVLRGFAPESHDQLRIHPHYLRAFSPALMKEVLTYVGFEVISEQHYPARFADYRIEARLKVEAVPQSALPVASPELDKYWQGQVPPLELEDDQRVLLMGTHIYKNWLIYRVQCQYMLGITLNFGEMGKRQKPSERYHFRHSRNPLKTLQKIKTNFDVMVLQGVFENQHLKDSKAILQACHRILNAEGQLYIQSLKDQDLWGHSFLHLRPTHGLRALLESTGFVCKRIDTGTHHHFYTLQKTDAVPKHQRKPLPESVQDLSAPVWQQVTGENTLQLTHPRVLSPQSYRAIHAHKTLEKIIAGGLKAYCQHLVNSLQPGGLLILSGPTTWPDDTEGEILEQLISPPLISFILQSLGMRQQELKIVEDAWVWYGFRAVLHHTPPQPSWALKWQGNLFKGDRMASVSRALLEAWHRSDVPLHIKPNTDPDFWPQEGSDFYPLSQQVCKPLLSPPDIEVAHQWPPNFELSRTAGHWVFMLPWEYGSVPEQWVYHLNKFADQVWVPGESMRQHYLDSGLLPEKVAVVPYGVNTEVYHPETPPLILETTRRFKFLYMGDTVSSKGLDILLASYFGTFSGDDDVCLVLKTYPSAFAYEPLNLEELLATQRQSHDNPPEVLHLSSPLPPEQMPALYTACDALVSPFRSDDFSVSIAEAMACEKPVIVTEFGTTLSFCNAENALLIPAETVVFEHAQVDDYITVKPPTWAQPDPEVLSAYLRHVYENPENVMELGQQARQTICENLTWQHAAIMLDKQLQELREQPIFRQSRQKILEETLAKGFHAVDTEAHAEAVQAFKKALQIDPHQPSVWYNLGIAYLMLKDYPASLDALTRSMREGTATGDLCYAMGTVLRHLGDSKTSQQFFAKAQQLNPDLFSMSS